MKKILIVLISLLIIIIPYNVDATTGWLRENSVKKCPNGVTYGMHGSDGKEHWHKVSMKNGKPYAKGSAIRKDPCPNLSDDTSIKTIKIDGNEMDFSSGMEYKTSNKNIKLEIIPNHKNAKVKTNNRELSYGKNEININITAENGETRNYDLVVYRVSGDNTIKQLLINDIEIELNETMHYETNELEIKIDATLNNENATIEIDNGELELGNNTINMKVTAENGDEKVYQINVNRIKKEGKGIASIKKFIINQNEIEFTDNKSSFNESDSYDYSYELDGEKAKLEMFLNDTKINSMNSIKKDDILRLCVIDKYGNENNYYLTITDKSIGLKIIDFISTIIAIAIVFCPIPLGIIIYKRIKGNKNITENNEFCPICGTLINKKNYIDLNFDNKKVCSDCQKIIEKHFGDKKNRENVNLNDLKEIIKDYYK